MAPLPPEQADYLRSLGVDEEALGVHQRCRPLDTHLDTMTAGWLYGIDLRENQRETWQPHRRKLLYQALTTLAPKGTHHPHYNHADLPRMVDGGFSGACFPGHAITANLLPSLRDPWPEIEAQYAFLTELAHTSSLVVATTPDEFEARARDGHLVAVFSVEGVHCLGPVRSSNRAMRLERLKRLRAEFGGAYITVNHFASNDVATSSCSPFKQNDPNQPAGPFADAFVATANQLGIVLDLSHTNRQGILDIARRSSKPVVVTHAGVFEEVTPGAKFGRRMLDVASLEAVAATDGCVGVLFNPYFLHGTDKDGSLDLVVRHYNRLKREIGAEHVCLGTDFDGVIASVPGEMRDAADLPLLTHALLRAGWREPEIQGLYCDNFLRVWRANLA